MACQTAGLFHIVLDGQLVARLHRPMTFVAGITGLEVQTVAKSDKSRYPINSRPGDILILAGQSRKLLYRQTRRLYGLMATHAGRGSSNAHAFARVAIRVARRAFQIRVRVRFVAERKGLLRRLR